MGVGGQRQAPAALPPGKTRYPLCRRLGGPRTGLDGCGKSRPHRDSIPGPSSPKRLVTATEIPPANHPYFFTIQKVSKAEHGLPKAFQLSVCVRMMKSIYFLIKVET